MSCKLLTELQKSHPNTNSDINKSLTPRYDWDDRFKFEKERLMTFENWPLEWLDKKILAATGMFYTGNDDKTHCYFCDVIIGKWELDDDPVQEHLRWSPNCPLLKRRITENSPINEVSLDLLLPPAKTGNYDQPPLSTWKTKPVADYSIKQQRLLTFADWPRSMKQKPEQLAEAGFYYGGTGDRVICFSCLGGLKDWEANDDPWEQHALWMGHYCPYVKFTKGEEFIRNVVEKFKNVPLKKFSLKAEQNELTEEEEVSMDTDENKMCKICFDKECNTAYLPCGHVVACTQCSFAVKECPLCRAPIERIVRLYFS